MKTNLLCEIFSIIHAVIFSRPSLSRLRIAAAGTLVLAGAGLGATSMQPPRLPWAVPTVAISDTPYSVVLGVAVDPRYEHDLCRELGRGRRIDAKCCKR